jgi:hypothetical protein
MNATGIRYNSIPKWLSRILTRHGINFQINAPDWLDHWGTITDDDGRDCLVSEPYGLSSSSFADVAEFCRVTGCKARIEANGKWNAGTLRIVIGAPPQEDDKRYSDQSFDADQWSQPWITIYGLKDPRDGKYRYVGQTTDLDQRTAQHMAGDANREKTQWVRELQAMQLRPIVDTLDRCTLSDYRKREREWIVKLRLEGHPLLMREYGRSVSATPDEWHSLGFLLKQLRALLFYAHEQTQQVVAANHPALKCLRTSSDAIDRARCRLDSTLHALHKGEHFDVFYGGQS